MTAVEFLDESGTVRLTGTLRGGLGGYMRWMGLWNAGVQYQVGDVVLYPDPAPPAYHIAVAVAPSLGVDPVADTGNTTATIGAHWYSEY